MRIVCERRYHPTAVKWRAYVENKARTAYDEAITGKQTKRTFGQQESSSSSSASLSVPASSTIGRKKLKTDQCIKMISSNINIATPLLKDNYMETMKIVSGVIFDMSFLLRMTAQSFLNRYVNPQ
jgi:hypothetical protein